MKPKYRSRHSLAAIPLPEVFKTGLWPFGIALALASLMTAIIHFTHADASLVNIPPLYLMSVQITAILVGSRAAVFASLVSFLCFDWFFVEPRYQLTVRDPFEFVALCVFLFSSMVVGQLTAQSQAAVEDARKREREATALSQATWTVASELDTRSALSQLLNQLVSLQSLESAAVILTDGDVLARAGNCDTSSVSGEALKFVCAKRDRIGWDNEKHWQKALQLEANQYGQVYLPIIVEGEVLATLFIARQPLSPLPQQDRQLIEALLNHVQLVLQREKLITEHANAQALAEANRLKTALLQMVSHDFRSPLASIKASVGSLLVDTGSPVDSETLKELLQAIDQETDRLNRMVGNILDLSKLEAQAWKPQRERVSFSELIGPALDTFSSEENERIKVTLQPNLSELFVDAVQITQVLRNLIENALKYSSEEVEISVSEKEDQFKIEISDRGSGVPGGSDTRLFEPFYRAPQHQESSRPGVGMGLAICKGLVEAHEGKIFARNRSGGGAQFIIMLPKALPNL